MDWLGKLLGGIGNAIGGAYNNATRFVGNVVNGAAHNAAPVVNNVVRTAQQAPQQVQRAVQQAPRLNINSLIQGIQRNIGQVGNQAKPFLPPPPPPPPRINVNDLVHGAQQYFGQQANQFSKGFNQGADMVVKPTLRLGNQVANTITQPIQDFQKVQKMNQIINGMSPMQRQIMNQTDLGKKLNTINDQVNNANQNMKLGLAMPLPTLLAVGKESLSKNAQNNIDSVAKPLGQFAEASNQTFMGGRLRNVANLGGFAAKINPVNIIANQMDHGKTYANIDKGVNQLKESAAPEAGKSNSLSPTKLQDYNDTMNKGRLAGSVQGQIAEQALIMALSAGAGNAASGAVEGMPAVANATPWVAKAVPLAAKGAAEWGTYGSITPAMEGKSPMDVLRSGASNALAGAVTGPISGLIPNVGKIPFLRALPRAAASSVASAAIAPLTGMSAEQGAIMGLLGGGNSAEKNAVKNSINTVGDAAAKIGSLKLNPKTIKVGTFPEAGRLRAQGLDAVVDPKLAPKGGVIKTNGAFAETAPTAGRPELPKDKKVYEPVISKKELAQGRSIGLTKKQLIEMKVAENPQLASTDTVIAGHVYKNGVLQADNGQKTNAAVEKVLGKIERTPEQNTAANPVKIQLPTITPGDYISARTLPSQVSSPIEFAGQQATNAIKKLSKEEKANFWKMVEDPSLAKSPVAKEAVTRVKHLTDTVHATSQALGGNTNYLHNYDIRNIDTSDKKTMDVLRKLAGGQDVAPNDFAGVDRISRLINPRTDAPYTRSELEAMHIKFLNNGNPGKDVLDYSQSRANILKKQGLIKAATEADAHNLVKNRSFDLKNGQVIPLSDQGLKEFKGFRHPDTSNNPVIKTYRKANKGLKETLLSASQFHPINIAALRAAPTLVAEGHPVMATKGLYRTFRAGIGTKTADTVLARAEKDGIVSKAAQIGMPFGSSDYAVNGKLIGRGGIGEHTVFDKQMPMMHDQVVRSIVKDLEKKGISLDSAEAKKAGLAGNKIMGYINTEAQNLDPRTQRALADVFFAPQFTRSGMEIFKDAATRGVGGSYARRALAANVVMVTAGIAGMGALFGQQHDNLADSFLRALIDPAVPTPWKDAKGNNIELRMPATYTSNIAKLVGMKLKRGDDGHLSVDWNPTNLPSTLVEYMRSRLAVVPSTILKITTNENFAGKPLYDPNADFGTQATQAATTIGQGLLPIGLQGALSLGPIKSLLPQASQDILNANSSGTNDFLKSIGSSFGLTPRTDKTVGKGLETSQYFSALDNAKKGLNNRESDALDILTGGKKNPVTGKYEVDATVYDSVTKADLLLQNPKVLDHLTSMNRELASKGHTIDPFYELTSDQQKKVLQINRLDPQNPDKAQLVKRAGDWYGQFKKAQSDFFDKLPPGDPNRPKSPVQFNPPSPHAQDLADAYYQLTDSKQKAAFIKAYPEVQDAFNAVSEYDKALRAARGLPELKGYPKANPELQRKLDYYNTLDKAGRSAYGKANPEIYNYFQQVSQFSLMNDATQARYVGNDFTPKGVKAIQSLASNIKYDGGIRGSQGQIITPTGINNATIKGFRSSGRGKKGRTAKVKISKVKKVKIASSPRNSIPKATFKLSTVKGAKPSSKKLTFVA